MQSTRAAHGRGCPWLNTAGSSRRTLCIVTLLSQIASPFHAKAGPPVEQPPFTESITTMKPIAEAWELQRNPVAQPRVRARAITADDRPVEGIPACGFDRPVFWQADDEVVVDRTRFTDLTAVQGRLAEQFADTGKAVGRLVDRRQSGLEVVKLLVHAGIVDANIHAAATVTLVAAGRDGEGEWFKLASDARYWTNQENREIFEFGVRVAESGEIRVLNPRTLPE
jgi:hypothetical protein